MSLLIDGNNLLFALSSAGQDAGRIKICRLVRQMQSAGLHRRIRIVFDGPPPGRLDEPVRADGVEVVFSASRKADELILRMIAEDSAPRQLVVVSTDREIRQAARRRRCRSVTSETFTRELIGLCKRQIAENPKEPPEKHLGSTPQQTDEWLKTFRLNRKSDRK